MSPKNSEPQFVEIGEGHNRRKIAFRKREGRGPGLVWLGGFRSDMASTKATAVDNYCSSSGQACLRFDYSGHGLSGGEFCEGTLSRWLEETIAIIRKLTDGPQILVGSSMGGHLAVMAADQLRRVGAECRLAGLVLVAPAFDFPTALIRERLPPDAREAIRRDGIWMLPSLYSEAPYPITRTLIEDAATCAILPRPIQLRRPVHIVQGQRDADVPYEHVLAGAAKIATDPVAVTLIPDGDHRLSRPQDIRLILDAIKAIEKLSLRVGHSVPV